VGTCNATTSYNVVASQCLGKPRCAINATDAVFGSSPCQGQAKWFAVQARDYE
jgi:hypothetical protein